MGLLQKFFNAIVGFFSDVFSALFSFFRKLFEWLVDALHILFKPVFALIDAIFYFLYKLGVLVKEFIQTALALAKLLFGLVRGGINTIMSLYYDGRGPDLGGLAGHIDWIQPFIAALKLNVLAGIGSFAVWIFTFYVALRIIGNMR